MLERKAMFAMMAMAAIAPAFAQDRATTPGAAIAAETSRYRFDLGRTYFPSPEAEVAARIQVLSAAQDLAARAPRIEKSAELLAALEADDRVHRLFRRHDLYLFWRFATDTRRQGEVRAADELRSTVRGARQALRRAVAAMDASWIAAAIGEQPRLARYAFLIETIRREAPYLLGPEQQAVVSALGPLLVASDYPSIVNELDFATVEAGGERLRVGRDQSRIETHSDSAIRQEGSRLLFAGYSARRDLFAHMLVRTIQGADALARLRGHRSAVEEAAFEAYVTPAHYEAVLAAVARHGAAYKQWQRRVTAAFAGTAQWSPSAATSAIVESAGALGPLYQREFANLLDPRNGRADIAGGDHRLPAAGTASVYPTGNSGIYMQAFQGSMLDLIILAHEGGHAVQAQLLFLSRVPIAYAAGPGYFTESFGRFQELLLLDHLHRTAREPARRRAFRDALAARMLSIFPSAEEASVELTIQRGVAAGTIRAADDLDAATAAAGAPYSLEYQRSPERRGLWMISEGYFMAPMQELNDAYASLLAVRYFALYRRDPADFRKAYIGLLAAGHDAAPEVLLRRHLGIDFMAPDFASGTMTALLAEVGTLYDGG